MKLKKSVKLVALGVVGLMGLFLAVGCSSDTAVIQQGTSDVFVQDFNPPFLDIVWMVDNRSPMNLVRDHIVSEAQGFFKRLDAATASYRMAIISHDTEIHPGQLQPIGNPVVLQKNFGTVDDRAAYFGGTLAQVINLSTGATDNGFLNTLYVLKSVFAPRDNVPLVLVFISDSDDHSTDLNGNAFSTGPAAIDYYSKAFLDLKRGNANLLRVYSVNYTPLAAGAVKNSTNRCATLANADIDKPGFQDRYFQLARRFSTDLANPSWATADLCQAFSSNIDISGLRQKELPKSFKLSQVPNPSTLSVAVVEKATGKTIDIKWSYQAATNEIVFDSTPPEGTSIVVTYHNA